MRAVVVGRLFGIGMVMAGLVLAAQIVKSAHAASAIQVSGAYALADGKSPHTGHVYLTISAPKGVEDSLVGASSQAAKSVALVDSSHRTAKSKSDEITEIKLDGHAPLVLQPRGPHLILHGLTTPLRRGQKIHVLLAFRKAAQIDVAVDVLSKPPAAGAPRLPKGVKID